MHTLSLLLIFLVLHLAVGLLVPWRPFFWTLLENAGKDIDRRLNRPARGNSELFMRGCVVAGAMVAIGLLIGFSFQRIAQHAWGWAGEIALLFLCVSALQPLQVMRTVLRELGKEDFKKASALLRAHIEEDVSATDRHAIVRRALEFGAAGLNGYFIAPVFFFALFQSPGLMLYVTVEALNRAFGTDDPRHLFFGAAVRRIGSFLNFIPALLTAALISFAAIFVSKSGPRKSLMTFIKYAKSGRHVWPVAAMAGAVGTTLGGPVRHQSGYVSENAWIGPKSASAKAEAADLRRGIMLHFVVFLCSIVALSCFHIFIF